MTLFGEQCIRCGRKRTRRSFEGLPTCEECETRIRSAREDVRACPIDGAAMAKEIVLNVMIDRCPTCGGVWLDGGELQLMRQAANQEGLVRGIFEGMTPSN